VNVVLLRRGHLSRREVDLPCSSVGCLRECDHCPAEAAALVEGVDGRLIGVLNHRQNVRLLLSFWQGRAHRLDRPASEIPKASIDRR
jgi:hypothetical protein